MDRHEDNINQPSHSENRLPPFMLNYEQKAMQNDSFLKVNGDHKMPQQIFPSDDESSGASTHSSSSSPRNLVIDHPDENSKDGMDEKGHKEVEPQILQAEHQPLPHSSNIVLNPVAGKKSTIKRKLSLRDTIKPSLPKKRRHSAKSMDTIAAERPVIANIAGNGAQKDESFNRNVEATVKPIIKKTGPFREYAHYLGLKPTTIPIKCFKCSNANFENLSQLRDHQKICLFKDKQRNSANSLDTRGNANISKNIENLNDGVMNSNSVEMLNSSLGPKQKQISGLPLNNTTARAKKRVFLCSACGTYYENWNLFLHMREVHKRHICLYCIGMFPSAERLTFHLEMKHDLEQNHFDCQEKLLRSSRDSCYLMCCVCEHLFTEHEDFSDHKCADHQQPCALCGQKGRHLANCKAATQSNKSKHKDHYAKRKSKTVDKSLDLPLPPVDFSPDKTGNAFINGGDKRVPETSILRKIITDRERGTKKSESVLSIAKTNGCAGPIAFSSSYMGTSLQEPIQSVQPAIPSSYNDPNSFDTAPLKDQSPTIESLQPIQSIENSETPPPPDEIAAGKENQINASFDGSFSQSNTTSELSQSNSSPEKASNESLNKSDITQDHEATVEPKPQFVPKFKIKIPKEFQTPLESEQSSTESDDNDAERSENGDEEQSDGSDMDIEEDTREVCAEKSDAKEEHEEIAEVYSKINEEEGCLDERKILKPEDTLPDQVFSPEKSPLKSETNESKEELSMEDTFQDTDLNEEPKPKEENSPNKISEADEDIPLQDILLQQPLDKIDMIEFLRICLNVTFRICLYCNHARRIAVNGHSFALHLISEHRFSATVDSITAEELKPTTILQKLKSFLPDLENVFFNLETYGGNDKENLKPYEKLFECFQCRFETRIHKELYLHNRKMHLKPAILCFMCRSNFYSYSEILCHMCPGVANKCVIFDIKFRCCLCDLDSISSAFRLMVHLRKKHFACDVCLEDCYDQSRLSSHVWKHKLHHLCYRCGIAYRNKPDITKHLFWKHGTESVLCKRCLQKRWPHVYHFCIPPISFVCEVCNISFSRAMALKVHKRLHTGDAPYPCPEDGCDQKFISRKLLLKHTARHNEPILALLEAKKEEIKEETTETTLPETIPPQEAKAEEDAKVEKDEKTTNVEVKNEEDTEQLKKKKKRSKKNKENLDDLMDLPAPNLSESDSSDESGSERSKLEKVSTPIPPPMLSPPSDSEVNDEASNTAGTQIMDIWENFKSFQASQQTTAAQDDSDDNDDAPLPSILHVAQSDHDYCMMFKPISKLTKSLSTDDIKEIKPEKGESKGEHSSPKKKQKTPRKEPRSGSESSSSGSSSSSDSSCSCGPNCSCGSSSGSSSDSSSSSDSDSSSSEGRRRAAAKRAAKLQSKKKSKEDEKKPEETKVQSPKPDTSDFVDVVTTDTKPQEIIDPDSIILESDLETEESDTDEDFYDEHPQKMANHLLSEKRKQLLMQTSLSPSHSFDIVENSRPSTPSIPEEMVKEKKVKIKKRKREKKISKAESTETAFKNDIPSSSDPSFNMDSSAAFDSNTSMQMEAANTNKSPVRQEHKSFDEDASSQSLPSSSMNVSMPAPITPRDRLSTGSSSDPDGNLKRSKRRRRPNKFYGYSSDDEGIGQGMIMSGPSAFKPTPPPNLTWRKEDLPAPSSKSSSHKSHKLSASSSKKTSSAQSVAPALPPIPPIIIRPSALLSKKPLNIESTAYKPPIVQPIRVPPVPVHHIRPPQYVSPTRSFGGTDSSSDDDHRLTIMTPVAKKKTKAPRARKQKSKNQQQQQEKEKQAQLYSQVSQGINPQQQPLKEAAPVKQPKPIPPALLPNPDASRIEYFRRNNIRWPIQPPAGARPPREGESVYCYCRCPYDEVSEMIACDGDDCMIEWFHFECVGILVPPQGKWFCPECRPLYPNEAGSSMEVT